MSETSKAGRKKLYNNRQVQAFLRKLAEEQPGELLPAFDLDCGYRFSVLEEILDDKADANDFLDQLTEVGILNRELHDKTILCPKCNSQRTSMRYNCPHCHSFNIEKSALVEHLACGYIDTEDHFEKDGHLVCPKCQKPLTKQGLDFRKAGVWCKCNSCGKSFDIPVPSHICRNCQAEFTFEDGQYREVYRYVLSNEAKEEASLDWSLVTPVKQLMEKNGYQVKTPGLLQGKSGADHLFDIAASKGKNKKWIVVDFATSSKLVTEQPVISMFAKIYDVNPAKAYLVVVPEINDSGKRMAKLYNITIIKGRDSEEVIESLTDVFT
ncbi:MAG: hypothetical protein JSV35_00330 [Candidatus Bathyarchaeota archaeon]|nr:MAG: hypothetical protein JSV35_00330 [Candidatus Bathyarchaeota archaeon]